MTLIYEYMAIMFIAFLLLAGIFSIGVVFLIIGLVTRFLAKKKQQVRDFLAESTSLSKFKQQLGEPNSDDPNLVCVYEIEGSDGGLYYAKLYYDTDDNKIEDCSNIVNGVGDYHSPLFEETEE